MITSSTKKPPEFASIFKAVVICSTFAAFVMIYCARYNKNTGRFIPSFGVSQFYGVDTSSLVTEPAKDEHLELKKILAAASTKDKTVIFTTLNKAWSAPGSIFDLFLESFRIGNNTAWLLNHILVVTIDDKAYSRCRQESALHCYLLKTKLSSKMAKQANYMTPIYLEMMWRRQACMSTILSLGYNFINTDMDVMWLRDPFPHFTPNSDFQTSCDRYRGREFDLKNKPNNGFIFVRSNNRTINFYKIWVSSRYFYPGVNEQDVFNKIKGYLIEQVGLKVRFLDTNYFGGFCSPSRDFNKVCTMHANCCVGLKRKIVDLNTLLEDWKNYMSSYRTSSEPHRWRVPKECRKWPKSYKKKSGWRALHFT